MLFNKKESFHLPLKTQAKTDEKLDQKIVPDKFIREVCWLKTFCGLHLFVKYDVQHCRCNFDEAFVLDVKQKRQTNIDEKKSKKDFEYVGCCSLLRKRLDVNS